VKISCEREALLRQLQTVSRVAGARSAIQALSGVHLSASSGGCELQATDMDVGLRVPLEAEVVREGAVVLPARLIVDMSGVEFCDSTGINVLLAAHRQARERGGELQLAGPGSATRKVLQVTGLESVFTVLDAPVRATGQ